MKKKFFFAVGLMLLTSFSFAAEAGKIFELGFNGGVPVATESGYVLGFGGQVTGLFLLDEKLAIGAGIGYSKFPLGGSYLPYTANSEDLNYMAIIKYTMGNDPIKPYLFLESGLATFSASIISPIGLLSASSTYPESAGGIGLQFPANGNPNIHVFVQGSVNVILDSNSQSTFTYIPVDLGMNFDL